MFRSTYKEKNGEIIKGEWIFAIYRNVGYYLSELCIYEDGTYFFQGYKTEEELAEQIIKRKLITSVPEGEELIVHGLCTISVDSSKGVQIEEYAKDVQDISNRLQGHPYSSIIYSEELHKYLDDPTDEQYAVLKKSFDAVPDHRKIYLFGMDGMREIMMDVVVNGNKDKKKIKAVRDYLNKS